MTTQTYLESRMMTDGTDDLRERVARQIRETEEKLQRLNRALQVLSEGGDPEESPPPPVPTIEYQHLGVTEAAKRLLEERKSASTREIVDALIARGVKTKSTNFLNTVFSTLSKDTKHFVKKDRKWMLVRKPS